MRPRRQLRLGLDLDVAGARSRRARAGTTCASATASWIGAPSQPYVRAWYCLKNSTSSATNVPTRPALRKRSASVGRQERAVRDVEADHRHVEPARRRRARAASGSAQMLNSAAGVMLPSAIAPPMSTIRRRLAMPRASASATFVSGPVGDEHRLRPRVLGEEVDRVLLDRLGGRAAAARARRARSRRGRGRRRSGSRTSGRSAPRATGTSLRPASSSTRSAFVGRLLERLVAVDGRDADELELRAREREQERDRVVVPGVAVEDDRRRSRREYGVHLSRGRE